MKSLPAIPHEDVELAHVGTVRVRPLTLTEALDLDRDRPEGENENAYLLRLMEKSVVDLQTGDPVYTAQQWDLYAAAHRTDALKAFAATIRMNDQSGGTQAGN